MTEWRALLAEFQRWMSTNIQIKQETPIEAHLMQMLDEARREWHLSKVYFNAVTETDLIDHAIFTMDAAEQRYSYLLKKAKAEGLEAEALHLAQN
ncbi:MAG TPA: DUF2508 family protein [Bacillota bacterium]|nr:DUF2508 family protein [Bacillota bacterium]